MSTPPFLDLPPAARATRVATARGELAALVTRPAGATGRPVLLVPGFTGSKEDFIAVLEPLTAAGHPVTAIDLRGQFESPGDDDPTAYDVKALADDVLAVAAAVGGGSPVHLVGHSFGGIVARAAAAADPAALRSLTLLGSGPAPIPEPTSSVLGLLVQALPAVDLETIWTVKRQMERETEGAPPPAHIEDFLHRRFVANHPTGLLRMAEQLVAEEPALVPPDGGRLPVLVAYGVADDGWSPADQVAAAGLLGAGLAEIGAAGHSPAAENPAGTARALTDFWHRTD